MEPGAVTKGLVQAADCEPARGISRWQRRAALTMAVLLWASAILPARSSAEDELEQMLPVHDGKYTKHGWNHYGPGHFELDPATGVLTSHGGMGLLWYAAREFGDFVLELEFKTHDAHTNSGIFLRVPGVPSSDDYIYHSFEVQIDEAGEGIHATGAVYDAEAPARPAAKPPGNWNHYRIAFVGDQITVDLNGTRVIDWQAEPRGKVEDFRQRGYVGLQNHDDRSPIQFRNIRIKEVGK
jgi:hypothetical protein